ncbi:hypothetical protein Tco_1503786 [Tanacetum coccineum]
MGAAYGSLRATDFAAAAKKDDADDDDTIKWYRDTNAQISVGVPMAPPLPTDDAYLRKEKEKVDVVHGKGIELLSKVALSEKAQMKEVRKKSLRDFHKTHPSGSGTVAEKPPSVEVNTTVHNEEQESDLVQDEESNDDDQEEEEFDQENESEDDEIKSDEEQGMDDTTYQFDDDADARLEEPTKTATGIVQCEGNDTEMTEAHQGNRFRDYSRTSYIPQTDAKIVSPLDVHVHHEVPLNSSTHLLKYQITTLEKEVVDLKKDPLHTQVTSLVDSHLDTRLGETRQEFMNFLSESLTARIKEQVKDQLPQILPQEVSNFAPPVIEKLIKESRDEVTLAKVSSQPQSTYEAASTLTEFELKKILLDKWRKRGRKDKDKDEDPFAGSDRGLKKRKTSKDVEPTTGPKKKDSTSGSPKCTKSQPKYTRKSVQSEEPVFEVAESDMPQDQAGNLGDNKDEPRDETASRRDWFKKPTPPKEPTDPDWNVSKTTKEGPTQTWLMNLAASNPTDKLLKDFDKLMSTPIDFYSFVLNDLKIENLTQEILLGPAFKLLKGTRSNYAELEYDFEECYKALSEKLDWENPEGGDYPFDLSKLFLRKSFYAYARGIQLRGDVYSTKRILAVTHVSVMRKHRYGHLEEIVVRRADNVLYRFKEGDDVADFAIALRMFNKKSGYSKASRKSSNL